MYLCGQHITIMYACMSTYVYAYYNPTVMNFRVYYVIIAAANAREINELNVKIKNLEQQQQQPERAVQGAPVRRCSANGSAQNEMPQVNNQ